jgi:hypothetical protein
MEMACVMYGVQADAEGTVVNLNVTLEYDRSISPRLRYIDVYDMLVMISCACGEICEHWNGTFEIVAWSVFS